MKSFAPPQEETKHIHASAADLLHTVLEQEISIGTNADIAKAKREKQIVFVAEVDAMLIGLTKVSEREGSALPSRFYGHLPDYQSHVLPAGHRT